MQRYRRVSSYWVTDGCLTYFYLGKMTSYNDIHTTSKIKDGDYVYFYTGNDLQVRHASARVTEGGVVTLLDLRVKEVDVLLEGLPESSSDSDSREDAGESSSEESEEEADDGFDEAECISPHQVYASGITRAAYAALSHRNHGYKGALRGVMNRSNRYTVPSKTRIPVFEEAMIDYCKRGRAARDVFRQLRDKERERVRKQSELRKQQKKKKQESSGDED